MISIYCSPSALPPSADFCYYCKMFFPDLERQSQIKTLMRKSYEALKETEILNKAGLFNGGTARAYSAIFHSASAVLLSHDLDIIKPSAAVSFFDQEIVKKGHIEPQYHKLFASASSQYHAAEYDFEFVAGADTAQMTFKSACDFVRRMTGYLQDKGWLG